MVLKDSKLTVSGTAKKNSKVKFFLNGKEVQGTQTQSDDKGEFIQDITDIALTNNILEVKVYDGKDAVIAQSEKISFTVEAG